jgi:hypothetical protein
MELTISMASFFYSLFISAGRGGFSSKSLGRYAILGAPKVVPANIFAGESGLDGNNGQQKTGRSEHGMSLATILH